MDELSCIKITRTDADTEIAFQFEWVGDYPRACVTKHLVAEIPQLVRFTSGGMILGTLDLIIDEWDDFRQTWFVRLRGERG